jgi:RNA polymerase sigma-70 factor (ECF subfamily)
MKRVGARDEVAFRSLVEQYQSLIYSFTYALTGDINEADELGQKVFVRAYRDSARSNRTMPILTWLYRMSLEECMFQERIRTPKRIAAAIHKVFVRPSTDNAKCSNQRIEIWKALKTLSLKARIVLLLREVAGQSVSDLVQITGDDAMTVRRQLISARQQLLNDLPMDKKRI